MKNMIIFFVIVALCMGIVILNYFDFVTPMGAEIMFLATLAFGTWYLSTRMGKEQDA